MDKNTISVTSLIGLGKLVRRLGGDPLDLLARAGLPADVLEESEGMIPLDRVIALLEIAAADLACPDFGMQLAEERAGQEESVPTTPLLKELLRNSPTIGAMMRYATDHHHLYAPGVKIFLDDAPPTDGMVQRFDLLVDDIVFMSQFMEHILLLAYRSIAFLSGGKLLPREIWFSHARISSAFDYGRRFVGCAVRFAQEYDGVFVSHEDAARPIAGRNDSVFESEMKAIEARFPIPHRDTEAQLRETLQAVIRHGLYSRADVARLMGLSISGLQRRLARDGLNFEGVRDDVRRQLALRYLARGDLPLSEIAPKLGYAEMAVLSRSCRRWFGMTPAAKRGQLLGR